MKEEIKELYYCILGSRDEYIFPLYTTIGLINKYAKKDSKIYEVWNE